MGHEHNRCGLFVRQDRIGADQYYLESSADWRRRHLVKPDAAVACPDIGLIGRLGDLYKFTPLDPFAKT